MAFRIAWYGAVDWVDMREEKERTRHGASGQLADDVVVVDGIAGQKIDITQSR